jgi:hypothetical protein
MKQLKRSFALLMLLTLIIGSGTSAQVLNLDAMVMVRALDRAKEVMQYNEYTTTGFEKGIFFNNPLLLNAKPLDYSEFTLDSKGILTVIKGDAKTGVSSQVPFNVYLRRNGIKVRILGKERRGLEQMKIELSEILLFAKDGDLLVIEAIRKEDGAVKRILKLVGRGC